ncbi:MAG: glycosyltransferase family 87 protein [Terracidiphilus sp.]|nr:glycosyltransferase family 87 protein [Terracidiphilus sp.]
MASKADLPAGKARHDAADLSIVLVSGLTLAITALFLCVAPLTGQIAGARDFVVYWATGQQLANHANPYDADAMMRIERGAGLPAGYGVLFMRNPPWALPLALPLGWMGVRAGALAWSLVLLGCLWGSVHMVWQMHGRPSRLLNFLGLSFAPALVCLIVGQTSLFALLGLVLFLRLNGRRPFVAGMALWLCALKPHLFLCFGVALVAWVVVSRSYRVLLGAAAALLASSAAAWWIDPAAWADYAHMMRTYGIEKEFIPCWSVVLRLWVSPQTMVLQSLLPALGCGWALVYFWKRRHGWDWVRDGGLLVLVSILCAPYCWVFDQAVAIPALLAGAYRCRMRGLLVILALASVAIEAGLVSGVKLPSPLYLWTAPMWLAWYLLAMASVRMAESAETAVDEGSTQG